MSERTGARRPEGKKREEIELGGKGRRAEGNRR
jgi:hypothetical protein